MLNLAIVILFIGILLYLALNRVRDTVIQKDKELLVLPQQNYILSIDMESNGNKGTHNSHCQGCAIDAVASQDSLFTNLQIVEAQREAEISAYIDSLPSGAYYGI